MGPYPLTLPTNLTLNPTPVQGAGRADPNPMEPYPLTLPTNPNPYF